MRFKNHQTDLAVVAHDAGAANLITAWCKNIQYHKLRVKLAGPAKCIWETAFGRYNEIELCKLLNGVDVLLTGTSFSSCLEHRAREIAKRHKIHNIAVLDHWVNYPERFIRNGVQILPDEIWVTDAYALRLAKDCFPNLTITLKPNIYLEKIVSKVKSFHQQGEHNTSNVLYVLEPIRQRWSNSELPGEFQALNFFVQNAEYLGLKSNTVITLRPHPSDQKNKYDWWVKLQKNMNIKVDTISSLERLIASADLVLGCESYAMVVSVACGKKTMSTLPPQAPRCRLPNKAIMHLREIVTQLNRD